MAVSVGLNVALAVSVIGFGAIFHPHVKILSGLLYVGFFTVWMTNCDHMFTFHFQELFRYSSVSKHLLLED